MPRAVARHHRRLRQLDLQEARVLDREGLTGLDLPVLLERIVHGPDDTVALMQRGALESMSETVLAIAAERQFNIGLSDEQMSKLQTVADIIALVQRLADEQAGSGPDPAQGR